MCTCFVSCFLFINEKHITLQKKNSTYAMVLEGIIALVKKHSSMFSNIRSMLETPRRPIPIRTRSGEPRKLLRGKPMRPHRQVFVHDSVYNGCFHYFFCSFLFLFLLDSVFSWFLFRFSFSFHKWLLFLLQVGEQFGRPESL